MRATSIMVLGALAVQLAGCATYPVPFPSKPIPVAEFVNSLKCEMAKYLVNRGERLRLEGWTATGTMDLNVVAGNAIEGGIDANGLVPFQGAQLGLGLSAKVQRKQTVVTTIGFVLSTNAANDEICLRTRRLTVEGGLGFGAWLIDLSRQLDEAEGGDPKFGVTKLDYQLIFAVERSGGPNGNLTIVPLKITAKALATRNDVQTIKIQLAPAPAAAGKPGPGPGTVVRSPIDMFGGRLEPQREMSPLLLAPE